MKINQLHSALLALFGLFFLVSLCAMEKEQPTNQCCSINYRVAYDGLPHSIKIFYINNNEEKKLFSWPKSMDSMPDIAPVKVNANILTKNIAIKHGKSILDFNEYIKNFSETDCGAIIYYIDTQKLSLFLKSKQKNYNVLKSHLQYSNQTITVLISGKPFNIYQSVAAARAPSLLNVN